MKLNRGNTKKSSAVESTGDLARDLAEALEAEEAAALIASSVTLPPVPLDRHAPGVPEFPTIGAGEWENVLNNVEPTVYIELPYGAFVWLWELVELRVQKYMMGITKLSPKFRSTYETAVFGTLEAMRVAALRHGFRPIPEPPKPEPKKQPEAKVAVAPTKEVPAKTKKKKKRKLRFNTS